MKNTLPPNSKPTPTNSKQVERKMLTEMQILCNACGIPLLTIAESKIGVHVSCVQEANSRPNYRLPSPRYGTQRNPSGALNAEPVPSATPKR